MKAKDNFDTAHIRAKHLLRLYQLLHDTRERDARSDWSTKLKQLMHWPAGEKIARIDGKDDNSLLILRAAAGIDRKHFTHEYTSELLRAALVAAVSAIDRYFHDIVVEHAWALLSKKEDDVPKELQKLSIPVLEAKKALAKLHSDRSSRPGYIVKKAIQDVLYRQTFQNPDDIARAGQMLGIKDFWRKVAGKISGGSTSERVTASLRALARRRNQIVHEADLIRKTKAKKTTLRDITEKEAADWINWTEQFIAAVHATVST